MNIVSFYYISIQTSGNIFDYGTVLRIQGPGKCLRYGYVYTPLTKVSQVASTGTRTQITKTLNWIRNWNQFVAFVALISDFMTNTAANWWKVTRTNARWRDVILSSSAATNWVKSFHLWFLSWSQWRFVRRCSLCMEQERHIYTVWDLSLNCSSPVLRIRHDRKYQRSS